MKALRNLSIRKKLFGAILVILVVNFLLLVLLGSTLFQSFYESNKVNELKRSANRLMTIYNENSAQSVEELYRNITTTENQNSTVMIFQLDESGTRPEMVYHSKMRFSIAAVEVTPSTIVPNDNIDNAAGDDTDKNREYMRIVPLERIPPPEAPKLFDSTLLEQMKALGNKEMITDTEYSPRDSHGGRITLLSRLDDNLYLFMETPKEYIKSTADLAVLYTAFISILILFVGALLIYYLSGRFTRPIREIDAVAKQIALMDFSQNCTVRSGDEIGTLAASINHMSDALSGNMEKLITANSVLKEDLARQQETDRIRRQFISDVSHDFKTPLTLIVSYAEALEGMQQQEQGREFCEIIADEGNRLSLMVGRLLKLSRLESGMEAVELSVFCLSEILDDAIRSYRLPMDKKQLQVVRDYSGQTVVRADYQKIEQVVLNLLENAVKYTPNGMKMRVSTEMVEGEQCRITVENEGSHIDEGELQNIFISFYRADKSRERALQSYGLGLAIVKTIMELHGSGFGVENTPDGVRFWFLLPTVNLEDNENL